MSLFGVECWAGVGRARLGTAGSEPTGGLRLYCPAAGLSSGILSPPSPEELFIILKPFAAWGGGGGGASPGHSSHRDKVCGQGGSSVHGPALPSSPQMPILDSSDATSSCQECQFSEPPTC